MAFIGLDGKLSESLPITYYILCVSCSIYYSYVVSKALAFSILSQLTLYEKSKLQTMVFFKQIGSKICARSIRRIFGSNKLYLLNIVFPTNPQLWFSSCVSLIFLKTYLQEKNRYLYALFGNKQGIPRYLFYFLPQILNKKLFIDFLDWFTIVCLYFILTLLFKTLTLPRRSRYTSSIESVL